MYDVLVDHAKQKVWCAPQQDRQAIIRGARLTPFNGVFNRVKIGWKTYAMPEQTVRFHIFQIGQLHPSLLGLFADAKSWTTIASVCGKENLLVDIYTNEGLQMPRSETWYMVTGDRNLVIAVKEQPKIPVDFNNDPLYFRFYSNAYFQTEESDPLNDFIKVNGGTMYTIEDILALQNEYAVLNQKPGALYAFINGRYCDGINLLNAVPGDIVEYVYDSSVYAVKDFLIGELQQFNSDLDLMHKYLLHYPGEGENRIDYHDDIDFFVIDKKSNGRERGIFYHRNLEHAVRMVTHRDYSMPVAYLTNFARANGEGKEPEELYVRAHIRKSGFFRPLVNENNRIKELYKLDDASIVQCMIGINSQVENWTARVLENSDYSRIMRVGLSEINRELVQSAYGYNAITKLIADTPSVVYTQGALPNQQKLANVPYELTTDSVAYEYDENGLLLGWHKHNNGGSVYSVQDSRATLVEFISGEAGVQLDEVYGEDTVYINPTADYRMYICRIENGNPNNVWEDVTGTDSYVIENNLLTWKVDPNVYYTMVRSNRGILAYDLEVPLENGILKFTLATDQYRNGTVSRWVMQVPMGNLDLYLGDGYSLIEGLDYHVNFPEIVVVNKKYLKNPNLQKQRITVRFSGHAKPGLVRERVQDFGYVDNGLLSANSRFDIRDDKVLRIVVGGGLQRREDLHFSETDRSVSTDSAFNGLPYAIRDIIVPLRGSTNKNTYEMRDASLVIDKAVSDYMTLKVPQASIDGIQAIPDRYPVYSPFCSVILSDLKKGILNDPRLTGFYSDMTVYEICKKYEYLLAFDPCTDDLLPDDRFVIIHPHGYNNVITLNVYQYKFINKVVGLYLKNRVSLSHFVMMA